jgi:Domain of unknown function (DUF4340)
MNLKQLGILLVLVAVLGGAGWVVYTRQSSSWRGGNLEMGKKLLEKLPVNDVSAITLTQGTNQLNLVKKDEWRVGERHDYPADYGKIRDFLLKAQDLKAVQSENLKPAQLAGLHLATSDQETNAALAVEFKGKDGKPITTLLLGKPHLKQSSGSSSFGEDQPGWPDGRYVRLEGSDTVAVVSDPLENIETKPENWLDKAFIHVNKAKSIEVDFPAATNSWMLTRETESGAWKLADAKPGEALDSAKTGSLSYPLSSPSFSDVLPGVKLGGDGTNQPTVVKIDTFDHFQYTLHVGQKTNEDYPVTVAVAAQIPQERESGKDEKPADKAKLDKAFNDNKQKLEDQLKQDQNYANWTYLVSSWTIDPLLKDRSELLAEKKEEPKKEANAKAIGHTAAHPDIVKAVSSITPSPKEDGSGTNSAAEPVE